ncbi:MAG TPA: PKD domain-containing protein, partial [Gemmataceae bacterium]|nr:PKD domain-containing protein [Gemmataceae bacterium]
MRPVPVKKWQKTVHRPRQSSRLLLLEQLEHRLVLSQIQDGWLIVAAAGSDKMHAGLYAIDPNDPDPMHALHPIATGADFHIPDGLYEDPSSGMLYAGDQGFVPNLPGRFSAPPPTPTSTLFDHHVVKLDPNAPSDPKDNTGALVTFDDPIYGENLYGTDGLVYLNGKVYVINQGDGGGNLHLLVNPDDLNNPQSYDPPTHSVLQIDPNTGIQSSVYNDGGHSAPVPRDLNRHKHDAAYPTGSDYSRETDNVDLNKSLDDEDPNGTDNHPDPEYGYGSNVNGITNDPSANEGAPLWMNVLTGIAPVYRSDGTLDPTHVYIADQQGPDDYQTTQGNIHKYGNDETDPDLSGYVWELDLTRPTDPSAAVPLFPTAPTLYRTQDVTVDPSNGNIIALGFAGYDTSGYRYTAAGLQPVIGVYDPVSHQLLNSYTFSSMTDPRPGTDLVQPVPPPQGQINPSYSFYLGVGGGSDAGDIYRFDTSTGMTTPLISSSLGLGDVTAMIVYHSPSSLVNSVNFETGSFDQLATKSDGTPSVMNAAIVNSPALDGQFSLQLSRNSSPAWAEIRQPDNSYYNLPTAYYSFEFQYASQTGEAGVVNFEDSTGQYKGALHLTQDGYLRVYDANGSSLDIGTTMLQPNLTYTISASIGTGPNAPWEVRINGAPEMSGKGNFGTTDNGGLLLGGRDSYTTNYYYDDVSIRSDSLPGTSPVITPAGEQTATEGTSSPIPLGSFSDTTPGANAWQVDVDWGDGSPHTTFPLNNPGDLTMPPHTYAEEGIYTVKLAVSNNANVSASASEVVNVSDHGLALMAQGNFQPTQDIPFNQSLVQFTDPGGPEPVSHYAATIDWGDGTPTTAGVIAVSGGVFTVSGSHTYTQQPSLPVTVTITHELTSVVVVDTATVSAAPSSQI